ncbi:MAG: chromosomal replication initiator protein DnaA [Solirubrobacterales bacterium]
MTVTSTDTVWNLIATELRAAVGADLYEVWLAPLRLEALDDSLVTIGAPQATRAWVADRFGAVIARSAARALGGPVELRIVDSARDPARRKTANGAKAAAASEDHGRPAMPAREPSPKYTFEQFVIGPGNRFAQGAALSVAENPGVTYNPLFICGPPGVGKTHLLHAIATYAKRHGGGRVLLTNAEDFASSFVAAIRARRMDEFKAHHRQVDMILVDDVQFLMDKARTEEEFFHTFNALSESGSQIVLACDRPPPQLERLEERLRDRLGSGLVAPVGPPDEATRITALRKRAVLDGIELEDEEVFGAIAQGNGSGNIRSLEAALIRVVAFASLSGKPMTPAMASEVMNGLNSTGDQERKTQARHCSIEKVTEAVASRFDLQPSDLRGPNRSAGVAWARQVAMFLCRQHTRSSTSAIGAYFGGRTHSAVLYAARRTEEKMAAEPQADQEVRTLSASLASTEENSPGDRSC